MHRLEANLGSAYKVAFSPDSGRVAYVVGFKGLEIHIAEVPSGEVVSRLKGHHSAPVTSVAFAPDGKVLASTGPDQTLRLWDVETGKELQRAESKHVSGVSFLAGGKTLLTGSLNGIVRWWDAVTVKELRRLTESPDRGAHLALSPDESLMACWSWNTIRVRELPTGKLCVASSGHDGHVRELALAPDGKILATGGYDGTIRLWDVASGKEVERLDGGLTWMERGLAYSADGTTLVAAGSGAMIRVWDARTRKLRRQFRGAPRDVSCCALSPDGKLVAALGSSDSLIRLFRTADGTEARRPEGTEGRVSRLAFSPDGRLLAVGSDRRPARREESPRTEGVVRLLDVETGGEVAKFEGHLGEIGVLTFSPDGRTLAVSAADDGALHLYELCSRARRAEWRIAAKPRFAFERNELFTAAFSHSGGLLAVGGWDRTVYLWDVRAARAVWRSPQRDSTVRGLAFHGDRLLASGGGSGVALVWDVNALLGSRPAPAGELSAAQLESLWAELASADARQAFDAVRRLGGAPKQGVALLAARLKPVVLPQEVANRIDRLIADLDSDIFATREEASKGLLALREVAVPALRRAAEGTPSPEVRRRANAVLAQLKAPTLPDETLRSVRAVEVLEHIGTADAIALLRRLTGGARGTPLTQEALAALGRLRPREPRK
jgi:WD40 repeat protein